MPTIAWLNGIAIRMFFNDHAPPHFHAVIEADEAKIDITSGELIGGRLPPASRRIVKEWTLENRGRLDA